MAVNAGAVEVRLAADFDAAGFRAYDKALERAQREKNVETALKGDFDKTAFNQYERALESAQAKAKRQRAFKAALGGDYDPKAFRQYEKALDEARREKDVEANLRGDFDRRGFDQYDRSLKRAERDTKRSSGVIGRSLRGIGGAALAAGTAIGITGFAKATIGAATDINESLSKNRVLFGRHAADVDKFSKSSARAFGISRASALEYTGVFGNLFRALGTSREESAKFSTNLTQLASDMASFNNTSIEDALEAIRSGLVGETEPLRRFGVNLNDAQLREEALRQGLVKTTKEVLPANVKALAAQALITKQTANAHGDFARTSGGLANQQRILKAQLSDVGASIGTKLLPLALKGATALNKFIKQIQEGKGAGGDFRRAVEGIAKGVGAVLGPLVKITAAVAKFVGKHPGIAKVAGAIVGLGLAVKGLKFARAVTGLDDLVAGARKLPGRIRSAIDGVKGVVNRIMGRAGTSGAERLSTTAADTVATNIGPDMNKKGGRIRTFFRRFFGGQGRVAGQTAAGTVAGNVAADLPTQMNTRKGRLATFFRRFGRGLGLAAGASIAFAIADGINKAIDPQDLNDMGGGPSSSTSNPFGEKIADAVKGAVGDALGGIGLRGGGWVPGDPRRDGTPALLSGDEFVATGPGQRQAVEQGLAHPALWDWLAANQAPNFREGGFASRAIPRFRRGGGFKFEDKKVGASWYHSPMHVGAFGGPGSVKSHLGYAELEMGRALGHLPGHYPLWITYKGKTVRASKVDIGAGGGPVRGHQRRIDLEGRLRKRLGFPAGVDLVQVSSDDPRDAPRRRERTGGRTADRSYVIPGRKVPEIRGYKPDRWTMRDLVRGLTGGSFDEGYAAGLSGVRSIFGVDILPELISGAQIPVRNIPARRVGRPGSRLPGRERDPDEPSGRGRSFAERAVAAMKKRADRIDSKRYPYSSPGNRSMSTAGPMDCSGAVSKVLGPKQVPGVQVSGWFKSWGRPGPGKQVTTYARGAYSGSSGHVWMKIGNRYFGTSGQNPGGGAGWFSRSPGSGIARHPKGLRRGGFVGLQSGGFVLPPPERGSSAYDIPGRVRYPGSVRRYPGGASVTTAPSSAYVEPAMHGARTLMGRLLGAGWQDRGLVRRSLLRLGEVVTNAQVYTAERLERFARGAQAHIRRLARGGVTPREAVQIKRLRAGLAVIEFAIGQRVGALVARAEAIGQSMTGRQAQRARDARIRGVDAGSLEGLAFQAQGIGQDVRDLQAQRGQLRRARQIARRAHDQEAIKDITERLGAVDEAIKDSTADLAETARNAVEAWAERLSSGVRKALELASTRASQFLRLFGVDAGSVRGLELTLSTLNSALPKLHKLGDDLLRAATDAARRGDTATWASLYQRWLDNNDEIVETTVQISERGRDLITARATEAYASMEHGTAGQQALFRRLGLEQQLAGTFETPEGRQARFDIVKGSILPALERELGGIASEIAAATQIGDEGQRRQFESAYWAKQDEILQVQIDQKALLAEISGSSQAVIDEARRIADAFDEGRRQLFQGGQNFAPLGVNPFSSRAGRAAGMRYFGAGTPSGGPMAPTAGVYIEKYEDHTHFDRPPDDGDRWISQKRFGLQTLGA